MYKKEVFPRTCVLFFYKSVDYYDFDNTLKSYALHQCDNPIKITRQDKIDHKTCKHIEDFCISTFFNSNAIEEYETITFWHQCLTKYCGLPSHQSRLECK